jgi:hypothetical protein
VCRQGKLATTIGSIGLIAIFIGCGFLWQYIHAPWFVWVGCMGLAILIVPSIVGGIGPLYRDSNWVFAIDEYSVWINLRCYRNTHFPEAATTVRLKYEEIESVSRHCESFTRPGSAGKHKSISGKIDCLQLKTGREQTDTLIEAIKQEKDRSAPRRKFLGVDTSSKILGSLVSVPEPGTIRILWRGGKGVYVTPYTSLAIDSMADRVCVDELTEKKFADWCDLEGAELDDLIRKLALSGDTISAATLLFRKKGISYSAAVQQVKTIGP